MTDTATVTLPQSSTNPYINASSWIANLLNATGTSNSQNSVAGNQLGIVNQLLGNQLGTNDQVNNIFAQILPGLMQSMAENPSTGLQAINSQAAGAGMKNTSQQAILAQQLQQRMQQQALQQYGQLYSQLGGTNNQATQTAAQAAQATTGNVARTSAAANPNLGALGAVLGGTLATQAAGSLWKQIMSNANPADLNQLSATVTPAQFASAGSFDPSTGQYFTGDGNLAGALDNSGNFVSADTMGPLQNFSGSQFSDSVSGLADQSGATAVANSSGPIPGVGLAIKALQGGDISKYDVGNSAAMYAASTALGPYALAIPAVSMISPGAGQAIGSVVNAATDLVTDPISAAGGALLSGAGDIVSGIGGAVDSVTGGSVICTELLRQGKISPALYASWHKLPHTDSELAGYRTLATPIVRGMRKSTLLSAVMLKLATAYFAHPLHPISIVGRSICSVIGKLHPAPNYQSLYI